MSKRMLSLVALACAASGVAATPASALRVSWMRGVRAPGTPQRFDRVGVIKVGSPAARNVLVLVPGTSAGSAYFVPLARWIVRTDPAWQVWSVERRENLLEDQSELKLGKEGKATPRQVFDYYLGFLSGAKVRRHFDPTRWLHAKFAERWGMRVTVGDLHRVIAAARRLGGKVVLGGHSLGGAVVTAYATWDFHGRPGADALAGLVYIDGASFAGTETAAAARTALENLRTDGPWLSFGGIGTPFAGVFNATGSLGALRDPNQPSLGQAFPLLPPELRPPVPVTNLAQYGYALNVGTSPTALMAAQAHLGVGIAPRGPLHGWDGAGALTPIRRFARMFSGLGVRNADGTEWYFPQRLTDDSAAVDEGNANPAQRVLGMRAVFGHRLPRRLEIYAFAAALGGPRVLASTRLLASQSHIPRSHLMLIDRHRLYAHNDPAGAYPDNAFFHYLIRFLHRVARG